jgi:hypothetical protein
MPPVERSVSVTYIEPQQVSTRHQEPEPLTTSHFHEDYVIKQGQPFVESYDYEKYTGILFKTRNQGDWFVLPPGQELKLPIMDEPYTLNGARKELQKRQRINHAKHGTEAQHERNLHFFATNWDRLVDVFYAPQLPRQKRLKQFTEVDVNDFVVNDLEADQQDSENPTIRRTAGKVDFLGTGPDGQIIIVEFGKKPGGKTKQLDRHAAAVEEVIRMKNHGEGNLNIATFIGIYERTSNYQRIQMIGPKIPMPLYKDIQLY